MADLIKEIFPRLQVEEYFKQFKFIKKHNSFRLNTDFGFYNIEFYIHRAYDLNRDKPSLEVYPVYGVRFDILSKWFEKFSFKTISDQRNNPTVFADGKTLGRQEKFYFLDLGQDWESDYLSFKNTVTEISSNYFSSYRSLDDYYINQVLPVINKERKMNDTGADWIFEYLAAVKLCQFERYDEMVSVLKDQIEFMNRRKEPNVSMYNDRFDYIFQELKGIELRK